MQVEATFPDLSFAYEPTPSADLNRILIANDTLIPSSGFRDTWVVAAIEDAATSVRETFALGLGDTGTDALASEELSGVPPDPDAFESTDLELRFASPGEAWRVAGRVVSLTSVPEPGPAARTVVSGLLLAAAARHARRRRPRDA